MSGDTGSDGPSLSEHPFGQPEQEPPMSPPEERERQIREFAASDTAYPLVSQKALRDCVALLDTARAERAEWESRANDMAGEFDAALERAVAAEAQVQALREVVEPFVRTRHDDGQCDFCGAELCRNVEHTPVCPIGKFERALGGGATR